MTRRSDLAADATPRPEAPASATARVRADVPEWAIRYKAAEFPPYAYAADVLAFRLTADGVGLEMLVVERGTHGPFAGCEAWPGGFVEWRRDADAQAAALRELGEETGLTTRPGYFETLDTYDQVGRDPRQWAGYIDASSQTWVSTGVRVVSKAHIALLHRDGIAVAPQDGEDAVAARWVPVTGALPWEDLRTDEGQAMARAIRAVLVDHHPADAGWAARVQAAFGGPALEGWNEERVADRYQLMHAAGLVEEAHRDRWGRVDPAWEGRAPCYGRALAFDHRQMLADALGRLRGQMKYRPYVLASLLPDRFTLRELRRAVEALGGRLLVRPNFVRLVTKTASFRIVQPVLGVEADTAHRRAQLHTFLDDVAVTRLDPSIRLPWSPMA